MTNNKDLIDFIKQEISLNNSEIFSIEFKDKKYWIKKARETKSSYAHKFFYKLFNIDVLLPVEYKNSHDSIIYETNKIKRLQSLGTLVPNIVYQDENNFALEDCGEAIYTYTRSKDIEEEKFYSLINKVIEQLATMHNANEYHGGAQTRNFTYKDDQVYAIDFEESFNDNIDIKTLQFRDLLLFILSLTKVKADFEVDYKLIINNYINLTQNDNFIDRLMKFTKQISFFIKLSKISFIYNKMGTDLKAFFRLIEILKTLDIIKKI